MPLCDKKLGSKICRGIRVGGLMVSGLVEAKHPIEKWGNVNS